MTKWMKTIKKTKKEEKPPCKWETTIKTEEKPWTFNETNKKRRQTLHTWTKASNNEETPWNMHDDPLDTENLQAEDQQTTEYWTKKQT